MLDKLKRMMSSRSATPAAPTPAAEPVLLNAYCTVAGVAEPTFAHELNGRRTHDDPELAAHLDGFAGYILSRGDGQMTATRYHLWRHVQRVREHWSLAIDPAQFDAFAQWATAANAVVFLQDGSIRDPHGAMLLDATGESATDADAPYPEDARVRKARVDAQLAARGIAVPAHLPPVVGEHEVALRDAREVAGRALALLMVAVRAETVNSGEPMPVEEIAQRLPTALAHATPRERAFVSADAPDEQQAVNFAWRYEALAVLEWALGLQSELTFASEICEVPLTARVLLDAAEDIESKARLRPVAEILDALDETYRLHWAARDARVKEHAPPAGLIEGVVMERHHALNWLVRFEDKDWDEVDTPT